MDKMQLIKAAKSRDADAFCALYEQYKDRLYRYAFYRLNHVQDAEDAVSDCVISAFRQIGGLKEPAAFDAWIFRILSGCVNARIREQSARRQIGTLNGSGEGRQTGTLYGFKDRDAAMKAEPGSPDPSQEIAEQTDLSRALETLEDEERNIVLLSVIGGFTSQEIAGLTGLRPGSVRSKCSRSLAKLRKMLEDS